MYIQNTYIYIFEVNSRIFIIMRRSSKLPTTSSSSSRTSSSSSSSSTRRTTRTTSASASSLPKTSAAKRTGLRVPRVSLRSSAKKIIRKTSSLRAIKQRSSNSKSSKDKSAKSAKSITGRKSLRNNNNNNSNNSNNNKNNSNKSNNRLTNNKPSKLRLSSTNNSNKNQKQNGDGSNVSSSLLSPTSNSSSPKNLSPKLVNARDNALTQIQELQRSLRQKEEEEAVLKIKNGTKIVGDGEDVDEEEPQEQEQHRPISNAPVVVIDDFMIEESDDNVNEKKNNNNHDNNNKNNNNNTKAIDEDFIRKTLLDPELKLSNTIHKTPRALITALTSRVKLLEATNNNNKTLKTNLNQAFESTLPNNNNNNNSNNDVNNDNNNETINFLKSQMKDFELALEEKKKQVNALMKVQENNQNMVTSERNINHEKEIELFNLRAQVSELRVELRTAKKETDHIKRISDKTIEETEKRTRESILKSTESHAKLVDRTLKKHEEKHDELELMKLKYKTEIASLNAELKTAQDIAKESTTTLRRHLDLALTADEELRETHAEAKTLREQVRQLDEKLSEAERIKRKVESEAMVTVAELAALREEVVINRKKHIDKMLGNVKLENSSMKQQFIDLQHEKDAIEEREMRLQDHCEAVQEELNNYKGRISRLESKYTLLHKDYKHSLAENRRIKKEMKDSKKAFPNSGTGINRSSAFLKNMKFAESATSLNRGLYSFPSASSTADEKLDNFSERGDIEVNSAKDISILSKQQNGNTDFNARAAAVAGKKNYNAAQKAAELINYPKISSKKNRHGTTKPVQAWRPGGNAKPPRKIKSNKSVLSPPQFDKDAYYNSNSSQSGNSNGRYKLPVQKPWEPKRVVRRNILKSNNNKSIPNGQKSMKSPKQKTPVVAVSLDDSTDDGGKFAAVDIVDINVAWDGDNAIDDADGSDKEIINKHAKIASIDFKEKNVHRSKLDELAQVLETLRSSPTSPNTI